MSKTRRPSSTSSYHHRLYLSAPICMTVVHQPRNTHTRTHRHAHTHTHTPTRTHTHTHAHTRTHAHTHTHTHARTHTHTHAYTHAHARRHAHTYTHTHARTNTCTHAHSNHSGRTVIPEDNKRGGANAHDSSATHTLAQIARDSLPGSHSRIASMPTAALLCMQASSPARTPWHRTHLVFACRVAAVTRAPGSSTACAGRPAFQSRAHSSTPRHERARLPPHPAANPASGTQAVASPETQADLEEFAS